MVDKTSRDRIMNSRVKRRIEAVWLVLAILLSVSVAGSFLAPEGIKALSGLLSVIVWPIVLLVALSWFKPEVIRIAGRVSEFDFWGVKAKLREELIQSASETDRLSGLSTSPSSEQIERATEVRQIVGGNRGLIRSQVCELVDEYQDIRASMPPGDQRTRRMEVVMAKMRTIGLAVYPQRYDLVHSPSPGMRLQAIAALQVKPDYDLLDWLAERLGSEKPFVGYHAMVALTVAASKPEARDFRAPLLAALERAKICALSIPDGADRKTMLKNLERQLLSIHKV